MVSGLSGKDICNIIRTCAKAGVSEIALGELKVAFGRVGNLSPWLGFQPPAEPSALQTGGIADNIQPNDPPEEFELSKEEREAMDEAVQNHMMIESPLAYEDEVINSAMREYGLMDLEEDNAET